MEQHFTSVSRSPRSRSSGFSLIELIVVIAILGLLVSIALPALSNVRATARRTQCLNHLRNITFGLTQYDHFNNRLPASGYYLDPPSIYGGAMHSWAVDILPHLERAPLKEQWDFEKTQNHPHNYSLSRTHIPIYVCPSDVSVIGGDNGDLSYVVNGGFGFTIRTPEAADCPISSAGGPFDLNGDGYSCTGDDSLDDLDREIFKQTGLFFLENWKSGKTIRHHAIADIHDGTSQTFLASENVRTGYDPNDPEASFADPRPRKSAFYIGNPCLNESCSEGQVNYALCNSGDSKINSGTEQGEGVSTTPNSFHVGGVNMAYADGHLKFLSEEIDGAVYAALASPQGDFIGNPHLRQVIVSGNDF